MQPPFSLALSRVPWTVFCSLTFRKEPSEGLAVMAAEKLLKWCAHVQRLKYESLQYVIRVETGEVNGRRHLHLLILVEPKFIGYFVVKTGYSSIARKWWLQRYGIAHFRAIDQNQTDSAVAYITKDVDAGADIYELAKTGSKQSLIISLTALRCIRRRIGAADRQERAVNTLAGPQIGSESRICTVAVQ